MSGTTVEAQNCATGAIAYSASSAATVINDAISALPSSGGAIFIEAGTYSITTPIGQYVNNVQLYGEGNSTILEAATNFNNDVISVENANGWYIHDLEVNGNRANQNGNGESPNQDGIFLWNSNNTVIERCYVHDVKTYGIAATGMNIKILDNQVQNANANGISVYTMYDYLVEGNTVDGASDVGIGVSGGSSTIGISNVIVEDNTILNIDMDISPWGVNSGVGIIVGDNGIAGGNITIENNYIDVAYTGMWINQCQGVTITGNTIIPTSTSGWGVGMAIGESGDEVTENILIECNSISQAPSGGIYLYSTAPSSVQVLNNVINSSGSGVVTNGSPAEVSGNVVNGSLPSECG